MAIHPIEGGCRCGQVRFRLHEPALITMACHCTGCQRMTSSAFSLSLLVTLASFEIVHGEPVIGGMHGPSRHYFCPWCMSWMYTRPEGQDTLVNVRATLLDDARGFEPWAEMMTRERLPWVRTPARRSYEAFPDPEEFAGLLADYARDVAAR